MIKCDICSSGGVVSEAKYDARTALFGTWAYMCEPCFQLHGTDELGIGKATLLKKTSSIR